MPPTQGDFMEFFFSPSFIQMPQIAGILTHEIWHLISRNISQELKNRVYSCIGFSPMAHVMPYPSQLVKISNPDATRIEHYIELQFPDNVGSARVVCLTPIIYSSSATFDPSQGDSFFKYMVRKLIVVQRNENGTWEPVRKNSSASTNTQIPSEIYDIRDTSDMPPSFWDKIGKNTSYLIHPEETIADNFMHLILQHQNIVETPLILQKLGTIFGEKNFTQVETAQHYKEQGQQH